MHWLATTQAKDQELQEFLHSNTKCKLELISRGDDPAVWCKISHCGPWQAVPEILKKPIFVELHLLRHPSVKATTWLVRECYFWPNMAKQTLQLTHASVDCQCSKV